MLLTRSFEQASEDLVELKAIKRAWKECQHSFYQAASRLTGRFSRRKTEETLLRNVSMTRDDVSAAKRVL